MDDAAVARGQQRERLLRRLDFAVHSVGPVPPLAVEVSPHSAMVAPSGSCHHCGVHCIHLHADVCNLVGPTLFNVDAGDSVGGRNLWCDSQFGVD